MLFLAQTAEIFIPLPTTQMLMCPYKRIVAASPGPIEKWREKGGGGAASVLKELSGKASA